MNTYKQRITLDAIIAERATNIRSNKNLIKKYSVHISHFDLRDKNQFYVREIFDGMQHRTKHTLRASVRALHLAKAFLKGQRFDKVEKMFYHPVDYKLAHKDPRAYGLAEEKRQRQVTAIRAAQKFLDDDQRSDFMLWVRNTSGMKINHEY